jgi:cytochrome c oxidase subunit IV
METAAAEATGRATTMLNVRMNQGQRVLLWLMLTVLAALVAYFGIRGYLSPELLFNFSNSFYC